LIKKKSKEKIQAAKILQRLIEETRQNKSFMRDEEMNAVEESIKHFHL
jgi:hypothetical protein